MKPILSLMMMSVFGSAMVACTHTATETITTTTTVAQSDVATRATVQAVYDGFAAGDMAMVTGVMADDIVWNEAQGHPYADLNPYIGADSIVAGLFSRLGGEWDYYTAEPQEYIIEGERVAVMGQYAARHKTTGNVLDAPFVHVWTVQNNEITTFQQYTDTAAQVAATRP